MRLKLLNVMFFIIGLGNPEPEYAGTRHNVGFMIIDYIANKYNSNLQSKSKFKADISKAEISKSEVILCKPATYMNLSGEAVQLISGFFKISLGNIIVIHDDIDLSFGKIAYKFGGGTGGHNGLKSIDKHIGINYHRIRVGIGRPNDPNYQVSDFVLGKFLPAEQTVMNKNAELIANNINLLISNEIGLFKKEIAFKTN